MKLILAMPFVALSALAATFAVRTLPQADDPLEASVQNEVDHAVGLGERWLAEFARATTNRLAAATATNAVPLQCTGDLFATNGLARAEIALKLVSGQKNGGWWITPTNPVPTRAAVNILKGL